MLRRALLAGSALALLACHHGPGAAQPNSSGSRLCTLGDPNDCTSQCEGGNAGACMELGAMYEAGLAPLSIDLKRATDLYARSCDMGNGFGCSSAGYMYGTGRGVLLDYPKAIGYYGHSCDLGVGQGCYNLGVMYEQGYGVPKDPTRALLNFEYGCLIGSAAGCSSAGVAYLMGAGVKADVDEASRQARIAKGIKYLEQGCSGGNQWGCERLKELAAAANGGASPSPGPSGGDKGGGHGSGTDKPSGSTM